MRIFNSTGSVRTSFALFGTLSAGASIGGFQGKIFICVGPIDVLKGMNEFEVADITFTCGTQVTLTDNYLAYTPANSTPQAACAVFAAATKCKDISPKCGVAATINIRTPGSASVTAATEPCEGESTGSFTITPVNGTAPYTISVYNKGTVDCPATPPASGAVSNSTVAAGGTKVVSNVPAGDYCIYMTDANNCVFKFAYTLEDKFCCEPPTIANSPSNVTVCPEGIASFVASANGGDPAPTVRWQAKSPAGGSVFADIDPVGPNAYSGATTNTLGISDLTGLNGYQFRAIYTSTDCTPATSNPATLILNASPQNPDVTYVAPLCDETTFSLIVGSNANPLVAGSKYTIVDKNGDPIPGINPSASPFIPTAQQAGNKTIVFGNIPAGSGYLVTIESSAGCVPGGAALPCGEPTSTDEAGKRAPSSVIQNVETPTTVKAYPNPFSDRIKFVVTSPVGGNGILDVYNMTGQKVKTVHKGYIAAGTQTFELSLPTQQVANLVYVLRIGDKKTSGKILQINR